MKVNHLETFPNLYADRRLRIVLFTENNSPFGERFLQLIWQHSSSHLIAVVTRAPGVVCPDYPANGTSIAEIAQALGIAVLRPRMPSDAIAALQQLDADHFIIGNFQRRLPKRVTRLSRRFCINVHVGPLPRYAGLTPWHWMWMNHETEGGVAAIRADERIDGGDIVDEFRVPLTVGLSAEDIRQLHFESAYLLLQRLLDKLPSLSLADLRSQDLSLRTYYNRSGIVMRECGRAAFAKSVS